MTGPCDGIIERLERTERERDEARAQVATLREAGEAPCFALVDAYRILSSASAEHGVVREAQAFLREFARSRPTEVWRTALDATAAAARERDESVWKRATEAQRNADAWLYATHDMSCPALVPPPTAAEPQREGAE